MRLLSITPLGYLHNYNYNNNYYIAYYSYTTALIKDTVVNYISVFCVLIRIKPSS